MAADQRMKIVGGTGTGNGVDIASPTLPRLGATMCDVSLNSISDPPVSWGVCTND